MFSMSIVPTSFKCKFTGIMDGDKAKASETRDILEKLRMKYVHDRGISTNPPTKNTDELLELLKKKYSHQPIFLQAVSEMMISLKTLFADTADGEYFQRVFWLLTEPEKIIRFRVTWTDDGGNFRTNIGYRVEWNR